MTWMFCSSRRSFGCEMPSKTGPRPPTCRAVGGDAGDVASAPPSMRLRQFQRRRAANLKPTVDATALALCALGDFERFAGLRDINTHGLFAVGMLAAHNSFRAGWRSGSRPRYSFSRRRHSKALAPWKVRRTIDQQLLTEALSSSKCLQACRGRCRRARRGVRAPCC